MNVVELHNENLVVHSAANHTPVMSEEQFRALVLDIETQGQIEPIKTYRGKIVDGRHRSKALKELGIKKIKAIELPNNATISELEDIVLSSEKRRHQTKTQLAIFAWKQMNASGSTLSKTALISGVSKASLSRLNIIAELAGTKLIDELYDGKMFEYYRKQKKFQTDALFTIVGELKSIQSMNSGSEQEKDREITSDEMDIIEIHFKRLLKESQFVRIGLADRLYAYDAN